MSREKGKMISYRTSLILHYILYFISLLIGARVFVSNVPKFTKWFDIISSKTGLDADYKFFGALAILLISALIMICVKLLVKIIMFALKNKKAKHDVYSTNVINHVYHDTKGEDV